MKKFVCNVCLALAVVLGLAVVAEARCGRFFSGRLRDRLHNRFHGGCCNHGCNSCGNACSNGSCQTTGYYGYDGYGYDNGYYYANPESTQTPDLAPAPAPTKRTRTRTQTFENTDTSSATTENLTGYDESGKKVYLIPTGTNTSTGQKTYTFSLTPPTKTGTLPTPATPPKAPQKP